MLKKTFAVVATLGLSASIFGGSAYAQNSTENKPGTVQYEKALKEYESKEEVQLALDVKDSNLKDIKAEKSELTEQVEDLSDPEFDRFLHNFVIKNDDTVKEKKEKLNLLGVKFDQKEENKVKTMAITDPARIKLTVYSAKRGGQNYYHLGVSWISKDFETKPATLDVVSLEWNPKYGKFYTASAAPGGVTTKRDGSKYDKGIYLFNVNDSKLIFDSYATVQVTKKKAGWLEYGAKYTHTYSTTSKTTTGQAGIGFDSTGPNGGYSYSVTKTTNVSSWPKYDENAVKLN
ncbi:hypothetical protein [Priestia megaterium]|uniref:Uncharacterized protein n=1 Tax=Priestia megaterium TaxID=1404 RepID=A0A6M6E4W9_PRIMG|nr:hypothetical protein [Priestia megaterium]QJX80219.1 hypothetical protein FDZ14_29420 [Priestia megaterium]